MKITKEQLAEELKIICKDEFNGIVNGEGNKILLNFETEQKFIVEVKESD